jgi:hypothetical protein
LQGKLGLKPGDRVRDFAACGHSSPTNPSLHEYAVLRM